MKNSKNIKYIVLGFILMFSFTLAGCQTNQETVATVGDEKITQDELNDKLVERYGAETLNGLISEKIVELEIKKQNIKVSQEDIDKEFKTMQEQYGGKEQLNNAIKEANLTEKDVKAEIENSLALEEILKDDLAISDEAIQEYYEENKEQFTKPEQISASHVLVKTEEEAKDIREKLIKGEDIAKLAKEYSTDEGTKDKGGDLGFFGKGQMTPPFEEAAFKLDKGEVSEPVKSEFGYHVIIVNEKNEPTVSSLEENKEAIRASLKQSKFSEAFNTWYSKKVTEYKITNNLEKDKDAK